MKNKILSVIILLFLFSATVSAANGDVAGNIYYTDIAAYMNDAPITSYNIGGKTVIDAEILNWHYGFDVYWYTDTRRLEITDKGGRFHSLQAAAGDTLDVLKGNPGDIAGYYYETDIVTTLNAKEIESYNIGGRTFIVAEDIKDFGYDVTWDETKRTLRITKPYDFYQYETDFGTICLIYHEEHIYNGASLENNGILIDGKQLSAKDAKCVRPEYGPAAAYVPLKPVLDAIGATYLFDKRMITYDETDADGTIHQFETVLYDLHVTYDNSTLPPLTEPNPAGNPVLFQDGYQTVEIDLNLFVNGKSYDIVGNNYKGIFGTKAYIHDGVIYLPTKTVANFMGYQCDDGINFYKEKGT